MRADEEQEAFKHIGTLHAAWIFGAGMSVPVYVDAVAQWMPACQAKAGTHGASSFGFNKTAGVPPPAICRLGLRG